MQEKVEKLLEAILELEDEEWVALHGLLKDEFCMKCGNRTSDTCWSCYDSYYED